MRAGVTKVGRFTPATDLTVVRDAPTGRAAPATANDIARRLSAEARLG
jgi:hypothetical protein